MSENKFTSQVSGPVTDAGVISDLAQLARGTINDDGIAPYVSLPSEHKLVSLDRLSLYPTRTHGVTQLADLASFTAYVETFANEDAAIFWDVDPIAGARFHAVFNMESWRDHRAVYTPAFSAAWMGWVKGNGTRRNQDDFAQLIEDRAPDIIEPLSADMIEISRSIEAKKKVNFASGIRLANGQNELVYEEQIEGSAAKGKLQIPETFVLAIPVFVGGEPYKVTARLRYRINDGRLVIWYDLLRHQDIVDDAVATMVAKIASTLSTPIYRGTCAAVSPLE